MKKTTKKALEPKAAEPAADEWLPFEAGIQMSIELASERLNGAKTLVALRHSEMQQVVDKVRAHYEENGKYEILNIDTAKGVQRKLRAFPEQKAAESSSSSGAKE